MDESFIQILTQIYEQNRVKDVDNSNEGGSKSRSKDGKGTPPTFSLVVSSTHSTAHSGAPGKGKSIALKSSDGKGKGKDAKGKDGGGCC